MTATTDFTLPVRTVYTTGYGQTTTSLEEALERVRERLQQGYDVEVRTKEEPMTIVLPRDWWDVNHNDDRSRISDAFRTLRKTHLTAMGRHCCSSCMAAEMGSKALEKGKGVVGFNRQAWDAFDKDRRTLDGTLYLIHGEPQEDGDETWDLTPSIVDALRAQGLPAEWSGDGSDAVLIHPRAQSYCHGQHEEGSSEGRWCRNCRATREGRAQYERSLDREAYDRVYADVTSATFSDLRRARRVFWTADAFRKAITELREAATATTTA